MSKSPPPVTKTAESPQAGTLREILSGFGVEAETPMQDVLARIDKNGEGIALVIDGERRLLGIVTDGDIRRAILTDADFDFGLAAGRFLESKVKRGSQSPLTASADTRQADLLRLMDEHLVRHLPLVDGENRIAGLALMSEIGREQDRAPAVRAVVMAGGLGKRLHPLTNAMPKPLLSIGKKPVIERTVEQLRDSGIHNICITTHYQAEKIMDHFGDGSGFGVHVQYAHEREPLGTAGALSMFSASVEPLLVINGDILTEVDFRAMLNFHREQASDITIGVRKYEIPVPFGVIEAKGTRVKRLVEKPTLSHFINAGIYLIEPTVLEHIPADRKLDMTDLIERLLGGDTVVTSFPIHEYWLDIGQLRDYTQAQEDVHSGKFKK